MPRRRCLDCPQMTENGSRCPSCTKARKKVRNDDRTVAKAQVARECRCAVCGTTKDLTADHVIPLARGGTNEGRRQTLCRRHNSSKGAR